ncbi:MAG: histone deacetylase [Cyclobacteriaceae bacterium]|nr:histone deacetylase [Cyclobacteriaceae bacterium HetDA_MAG_MS6]
MLRIAWDPAYVLPLRQGHRFPMSKYDLLPQQLLYEGTIDEEQLFVPEPVDSTKILAVHSTEYLSKLESLTLSKSEIRVIGFPLSRKLIDREKLIMGGTLQCAIEALEHGVSMNVAGGTHHAFSDRGEGFCLLNDIAIAARFLLDQGLVSKVLIVDLDVHQGNGTAEIFRGDDRVFTFSMHGKKNYPHRKEESDLDVALEDGAGDDEYLSLLEMQLDRITDRFNPDFVFFQSGVDVLATDKLGRLALTLAGCKQRDRMVLEWCFKKRLPVVASMGGGYSEKIGIIVEAHANTFRLAREIYF